MEERGASRWVASPWMVAFSLLIFSWFSEVQKAGMNPKLKGDLIGRNTNDALFLSQSLP